MCVISGEQLLLLAEGGGGGGGVRETQGEAEPTQLSRGHNSEENGSHDSGGRQIMAGYACRNAHQFFGSYHDTVNELARAGAASSHIHHLTR